MCGNGNHINNSQIRSSRVWDPDSLGHKSSHWIPYKSLHSERLQTTWGIRNYHKNIKVNAMWKVPPALSQVSSCLGLRVCEQWYKTGLKRHICIVALLCIRVVFFILSRPATGTRFWHPRQPFTNSWHLVQCLLYAGVQCLLYAVLGNKTNQSLLTRGFQIKEVQWWYLESH